MSDPTYKYHTATKGETAWIELPYNQGDLGDMAEITEELNRLQSMWNDKCYELGSVRELLDGKEKEVTELRAVLEQAQKELAELRAYVDSATF